MAEMSGPKAYAQLDSIRGLAALTVVACHYITRFKISETGSRFVGDISNRIMFILKHTPLRALWAGHEAVILFFILSGFVLSLSFLGRRRKDRYGAYLIRRICRIYIPYLFVILCAIKLRDLFYTGEIGGLSDTFNRSWRAPANESAAIAGHLFMIGNFDVNAYDGSIWSLVHEMRISILFPLLFLFCKKCSWVISLAAAAFLSFLAYLLAPGFQAHDNIFIRLFGPNILMTLHYTGFFMLGAVMAIYREQIIKAFHTLSKNKMTPLVLFLGLLAYTGFRRDAGLPDSGWVFLSDWAAAAGAAVFLAASISSGRAKKVLRHKLLAFTGRISYSLYLWHIVVLNAFLHGMYGNIPVYLILPQAFLATIFISWITYGAVEVPGVRIGKKLSGGYRRRGSERFRAT